MATRTDGHAGKRDPSPSVDIRKDPANLLGSGRSMDRAFAMAYGRPAVGVPRISASRSVDRDTRKSIRCRPVRPEKRSCERVHDTPPASSWVSRPTDLPVFRGNADDQD